MQAVPTNAPGGAANLDGCDAQMLRKKSIVPLVVPIAAHAGYPLYSVQLFLRKAVAELPLRVSQVKQCCRRLRARQIRLSRPHVRWLLLFYPSPET